MAQESAQNRLKLWDKISVKKQKYETEIVIEEMICSWLCLFFKKLDKNRTGISIPSNCYHRVAQQVVIKMKEVLPADKCKIMTKQYFVQNIVKLLQNVSMKEVLLDAF